MDLGKNLTYGGLPYGCETGWELHAWWFYLPLMAVFAYLFYTSSRAITIYWVCAVLFILTGIGSGFGGIMGGISIVLYGYVFYKRYQEKNASKSSIIVKDSADHLVINEARST